MTRRTTGGNVRHHSARNLWEARYVGADGRRHSLYRRSEREAQRALRAALADADAGIRPVSQQLTVGAFLDDWLAGSVDGRRRPTTAFSYRHTVDAYLRPAIGRIPLAKLQPEHVTRLMVDLLARGLSPTTVGYARTVLRIALTQAVRQGKVPRNVAGLTDPPRRHRPELHPLTAEQARAFVASLQPDTWGALFATAVGTGMRQGELLALRWQDIDLTAGLLTVRHALDRRTRQLAEPKTASSKRTLRLPAFVVNALSAQRERQAVVPLSGLVFTTPKGTALDPSNVLRVFRRALDRAGLPRQRFHDLRHAYATLALEAGEPIDAVSRALGHTSIATTADIYGHWTPAMAQRLADRMDEVLGG